MKKRLIFSLVIISISTSFSLLFSPGCEEGFTLSVDCNECYYPEPDSVEVKILLSFPEGIEAVPLVLYRGEADKKLVDWVDTIDVSPYYLAVAVDKNYSVKAEYIFDDKTIFAIDETKIRTTLVSDVCNEDCYVLKNDVLDVRLK